MQDMCEVLICALDALNIHSKSSSPRKDSGEHDMIKRGADGSSSKCATGQALFYTERISPIC